MCGCHFREEHQTAEGEAQRDDDHYAYVAIWEYQGEDQPPQLHQEPLIFTHITPTPRCYK
ncbi:succinate dehydrogenase flavoprotein subunit [Thioploca ingrica]|uniref:Succinate dehydrogenase flavoprotein subunit n=1 Tax=Thioploca ingrica TaxID=40754 RepID=A0A090BW83_9GAMM|nr:succinate dehydrogenase flavoprotein subunit [Thioploca ingrica]